MDYLKLHEQFKEQLLFGRYIHLEHIEPLLKKIKKENRLQIIGKSVLKNPIYGLEIGHGKIKILIWSQMHGNESTTTKAIFDFFNLLQSETELAKKYLENITFYFIPMLNPDGSKLYTRENANGIDLNRDAQNQSEPESKILMEIYHSFKPDFCYNMHDQRTIYGVGSTNKPATVSFLAPSYNEERDVNPSRGKAMQIIGSMNDVLKQYIPDQIGRFDDGFNFNCVGDTFQYHKTPTILFESGHFPNDYDREQTRKYIFIALLSSFNTIIENVFENNKIDVYMNIPQNNTAFFDIIYKNVKINYDNSENLTNIAIQYNEELIENKIHFKAYIVDVGEINFKYGHFEFDAKGKTFFSDKVNKPLIDSEASFFLDDIEIKNGLIFLNKNIYE